MFNLEQAIADWRKQMLSAGINSPVPLEELEIHLREEIERRMKSGADEQNAFEGAVIQIGHAAMLKNEFQKDSSLREKLSEDATTSHVLGLLWLVYCLGSFYHTTRGLMSSFPVVQITPLFVLAWFMNVIYVRGVVASVLMFGGVTRERRFILFLAVLDAIGGVAFLLSKAFQPLSLTFTILGFVTIWLLWPTRTDVTKHAQS